MVGLPRARSPEKGIANVDEDGKLLVELLGLPASSRAMLARQLLTSLEEDELPDVNSRWIEVAKRRAAEIDEGKVECIPAEEVFRELREELG